MTTPVHPRRIAQLLRAVERDAHRRGWDAPPGLYALLDTADPAAEQWCRHIACGPTTRVDDYTAVPCVPADVLAPNPVHVLFRLALNLRHTPHHPRVVQLSQRLAAPGLLGLAVVAEAWRRPELPAEQQPVWAGRRAADIPGAVEMRFAIAATVTAATVHVFRDRGQQPTAMADGSGGRAGVDGVLVDALRTIVAAVTGQPLPAETGTVPAGWDWDRELAR